MTNKSQINTLLAALREERTAAAAKNDAVAVKKIDFIGKSINRLVEKSLAA